jgi:glycosyltransferase involved in cell wall biosynthesis
VPLNLARYQRELGAEPEIWCFEDAGGNEEIAKRVHLEGAVRTFPARLPGKFNYSPQAACELKNTGARFDVIHQHGIWLWHSQLAALGQRKLRKPLVVSPHGTLEQGALEHSRMKKAIALRLWEHRNLKKADCLHATSEKELGSIRAFGLSNPVMLLPNGVPPELLNKSGNREAFLARHHIPSDRRILLFLSRIHRIKGLPMLLEAVENLKKQFSNWLLVIAGTDEGGHERELREKVKTLQIESCVRFVGPLFEQEKFDAYSAASAFVLPSTSENFSIAVAEALAFRLPVLTTTGAPWKEIAINNAGWWVDPVPESIKAGLEKLLAASSADLRQMGERARSLIATQYLWNQIAEKSLRFYEALIRRDMESITLLNNLKKEAVSQIPCVS